MTILQKQTYYGSTPTFTALAPALSSTPTYFLANTLPHLHVLERPSTSHLVRGLKLCIPLIFKTPEHNLIDLNRQQGTTLLALLQQGHALLESLQRVHRYTENHECIHGRSH